MAIYELVKISVLWNFHWICPFLVENSTSDNQSLNFTSDFKNFNDSKIKNQWKFENFETKTDYWPVKNWPVKNCRILMKSAVLEFFVYFVNYPRIDFCTNWFQATKFLEGSKLCSVICRDQNTSVISEKFHFTCFFFGNSKISAINSFSGVSIDLDEKLEKRTKEIESHSSWSK